MEPDRLFDGLPNSLRPSSGSPGNQVDSSVKALSNHHSEHHNSNLENAVYTPPTLIPPRVMPLLHDLAQQMVQAGHQQQLLKIYRLVIHSIGYDIILLCLIYMHFVGVDKPFLSFYMVQQLEAANILLAKIRQS